MTETEAIITLVLLAAAGSLAIPGWLLNERDRERRYACRMYAWMALLGDFGVHWAEDMDRHRWGWAALGLVCVVVALRRVAYWWRQVEAIREVKRLLREKPSWLR